MSLVSSAKSRASRQSDQEGRSFPAALPRPKSGSRAGSRASSRQVSREDGGESAKGSRRPSRQSSRREEAADPEPRVEEGEEEEEVEEEPPYYFPEQIDNHAKFVNVISELFNEPEWSDVTLEVGEQVYHAHQVLLVQGSDFFRDQLAELRDARCPVLSLEEKGECARNFEHFLRFVYGEKVQLTTQSSLSILRLAEKYGNTPLRDFTVQYMIHHCAVPTLANFTLAWYRYAKRAGIKVLQEACFNFILCNFDTIMQSPGWLEIGKNTLKRFIADSDLIVEDEFTLFEGVQSWLVNENRKYKEDGDAIDVLKFIRFPMISPEKLQAMKEYDVMQEYQDQFQLYFYDAFQWHATSSEFRNEDSFTIPQVQFCPRNYLSKEYNVCQRIVVNPSQLMDVKEASDDEDEEEEDEEEEEEDDEKDDASVASKSARSIKSKSGKSVKSAKSLKSIKKVGDDYDLTERLPKSARGIGQASKFSVLVSKPVEKKNARQPLTFCRKLQFNGKDETLKARVCTGFVRQVGLQQLIETVAIQDHHFSSRLPTSFMHYPPTDFRLESYEDYVAGKAKEIEMVIFVKPQEDFYI